MREKYRNPEFIEFLILLPALRDPRVGWEYQDRIGTIPDCKFPETNGRKHIHFVSFLLQVVGPAIKEIVELKNMLTMMGRL